MKKNELVHFHSLLVTIAEEFVDSGLATKADFAEYDVLDVSPLALRAARDDHERAVLTLARLLADVVREPETPSQAVEAN
ncbi:UPF0058 family protein [Salinirubrum litoreum]|uniref:UPF0058 family protein n=1 Tax=Salinirubrum litoreum TaxID=1126234 RepID=A0ABD5R8A4_9EURY|nr:UPF0058 family protein [Salinirubrum litoreum]